MALERNITLVGKAIDELQGGISTQPWRALSRTSFSSALNRTLEELEEFKRLFDATMENIAKEAGDGAPDVAQFEQEMNELLAVLRKNLAFEKDKKSSAKAVNVLEKEETPELYGELEQRVLAFLLKARYAMERLVIFARKEGLAPVTDRSTGQQIMEVLRRKEDELQQLREKYEEIRKKSYMGYFEEQTTADFEQQLVELGKTMVLSADELGKGIGFHKSQVDYIETSLAEMKQKVDLLQETFSQYSRKAEELIKSLKKERDYAKKVVLDVEHETLQLRSTYTQEMLNLQGNKLAAKAEAERRLGGEIKRLQHQLAEQEDLAKHFRQIAENKLQKEAELESKIKRFTLLLKTKEKHDSVKRHFQKARKRK
ncbi:MAG: hypothetical protein NTW59_03455 [Candidatus Diapherotrites archaeon]|nr:hypothetical protein [Candidatus Diapherotrites archaeon]